jgi:hypothetical protein
LRLLKVFGLFGDGVVIAVVFSLYYCCFCGLRVFVFSECVDGFDFLKKLEQVDFFFPSHDLRDELLQFAFSYLVEDFESGFYLLAVHFSIGEALGFFLFVLLVDGFLFSQEVFRDYAVVDPHLLLSDIRFFGGVFCLRILVLVNGIVTF